MTTSNMTPKQARRILRRNAYKLAMAKVRGRVPRWLDRLWRQATAAILKED